MHKWAWVMAVSLNYCTPLHLSLKFCNRFNRQKQENDKIKFWKSVPSYVLVRKYQWRNKIIFIPSNKWKNLKNVMFYRQQIAYNIQCTQYDVTCRTSSIVYTTNGGMNRQSSACQKTIDRNIYRCQGVQTNGALRIKYLYNIELNLFFICWLACFKFVRNKNAQVFWHYFDNTRVKTYAILSF